ncbi:MAG: redoxin family protein [Sphingomonas bacterium]|nr:redoxin family protein [Sphingomonas bacterium]
MKRLLLWVPVVAFVAVIAVLASGLFTPADRAVRSAMIGQPLPQFALNAIVAGKPGLASADFGKGQPRLLNVFASWCAPCIAEAPILMQLKAAGVKIDGVAIRDTEPALRAFLARNGDPFERIGGDKESRIQFALGSSGVPESFVIDGRGRIVHQHIGDIKADDVPAILAAVRGAQ